VWLIMVPLPHMLWGATCLRSWGTSFLGVIKPIVGWPGSIFLGAGQLSLRRSTYVLVCVAFIAVSTAALGWRAWQTRGRDALLTSGTIFSAIFLIFHLSLHSMVYKDGPITLFNFLDRYLVALWPFALLPWLRFIRLWMVTVAAVVSVMLSAWWTYNYFLDPALQTAPM
jgi:hypothetical protein